MTTVVLFSGGMDSATLLAMLARDNDLLALSFDYGQTHRIELDYARRFAAHLNVEHIVLPLPAIFQGSALTGDVAMPHGRYTDESMRQTVVANRNMVMLAIAAAMTIQLVQDRYDRCVAYAAHRDDHGIYPDCRPVFINAMRLALRLCDYEPVELVTPFINMTKRDIACLGKALGIDYSKTWSCYTGDDEPCGKCGACSARAIALSP